MTIVTGISGHAPCALVQPITRKPMTVGELKRALESIPDDVWVFVEGPGSVNKVHHRVGERLVVLMHLGA